MSSSGGPFLSSVVVSPVAWWLRRPSSDRIMRFVVVAAMRSRRTTRQPLAGQRLGWRRIMSQRAFAGRPDRTARLIDHQPGLCRPPAFYGCDDLGGWLEHAHCSWCPCVPAAASDRSCGRPITDHPPIRRVEPPPQFRCAACLSSSPPRNEGGKERQVD